MHLDVQVCVPCMLTGVGGVLGAFHYSVSHCLETRSLAESEASLSLGWAAELSKPVCIPIPWCWGCWHVETCVTFYMDSRILNSGSHTCHTSQPTHWTMLQSSFVFGGAVIWLWTSSMLVPYVEFISLCTPSEKDERTGIVSSSEWESYAPLIYFLY